jgi:hypothetical protein
MLRDLLRHATQHGRTHAAVAVNVGGRGKRTAVTSVSATKGGEMNEDEQRKDVTDEELEQQEGEPLPERTQMSLIRLPGHTLPVEPPVSE